MPINDNIKFLENIKQKFKRTISLSKYRSEITTQPKNYNLVDPVFSNIRRLFVLSFKNSNGDPTRLFFDEYYMPLVEMKDFSALIEKKTFFDQPVKKARGVWKTCWNVKK